MSHLNRDQQHTSLGAKAGNLIGQALGTAQATGTGIAPGPMQGREFHVHPQPGLQQQQFVTGSTQFQTAQSVPITQTLQQQTQVLRHDERPEVRTVQTGQQLLTHQDQTSVQQHMEAPLIEQSQQNVIHEHHKNIRTDKHQDVIHQHHQNVVHEHIQPVVHQQVIQEKHVPIIHESERNIIHEKHVPIVTEQHQRRVVEETRGPIVQQSTTAPIVTRSVEQPVVIQEGSQPILQSTQQTFTQGLQQQPVLQGTSTMTSGTTYMSSQPMMTTATSMPTTTFAGTGGQFIDQTHQRKGGLGGILHDVKTALIGDRHAQDLREEHVVNAPVVQQVPLQQQQCTTTQTTGTILQNTLGTDQCRRC